MLSLSALRSAWAFLICLYSYCVGKRLFVGEPCRCWTTHALPQKFDRRWVSTCKLISAPLCFNEFVSRLTSLGLIINVLQLLSLNARKKQQTLYAALKQPWILNTNELEVTYLAQRDKWKCTCISNAEAEICTNHCIAKRNLSFL